MNSLIRIAITRIIILIGAPLTAIAGPCDAYFTFDDTLADASGNGYHGQMIGAKGASARANYTDGKYGRALELDGTGGMRALIDLHWDVCPRVTISAWIKVARDAANDSPVLFSSGQGSGPGLYFSTNYLRLNGTENGIYQPNAVRTDNWIFVAGVYDYETGAYELYWGRRGPTTGTLSQYRREPESSFWIGTENDDWGHFVSGVAVDELRITGRDLNKDAVLALRAQTPASAVASASGPTADTIYPDARQTPDSAPGGSGGDPLADMRERNARNTPDIDYDPPPDLTQGGSGGSGGDPIAGMRERNARNAPDIDYDQPPDLTQGGSGGPGGDPIAGVRERNARNAPDIDYDQPPVLLNRESTGGGNADSQTATNDSSEASMTVGEYMGGLHYGGEPTGDVGDCTSFSEVVADLANTARRAIIQAAMDNYCPLMQKSMETTMSDWGMSAGDMDDPEFQQEMLGYVHNVCVAGTVRAAHIPDSMLNFWNQTITGGGWATIGPRKLVVGDTHYGDLRSPGDRKFISVDPFGHEPDVEIEIEEQSGRARVTARICTVSMHNHYKLVHTLEINDRTVDRQNSKQRFRPEVYDVSGKFLIVYMNAHGTPNRHFKYELTPKSKYTTN